MNRMLNSLMVCALLLPIGSAGALEATGTPAAMVEDAAVAVATVVAIDKDSRTVTLKGPEGDEFNYTAGPEVRNFDQVERGDRVIVQFYESMALALGPAGSGVRKRVDTLDFQRAEPGAKPGASVTGMVEAEGTVEAIDVDNRTVTLRGAQRVVTLEVSEEVDLSTVEVGDTVDAVYVISYAIAVEPAPEVSGTVELSSTSIAIGVGVEWGNGTLTMADGSTHNFKVGGLSLLDLGVTTVEASGTVYHLVEASDLEGTYLSGEAGATLVAGGSARAMKNSKGVVLNLTSKQQGVRLTLAPGGMKITLAE